jgi:hypothetical protein
MLYKKKSTINNSENLATSTNHTTRNLNSSHTIYIHTPVMTLVLARVLTRLFCSAILLSDNPPKRITRKLMGTKLQILHDIASAIDITCPSTAPAVSSKAVS